jgi:hypothetical protein
MGDGGRWQARRIRDIPGAVILTPVMLDGHLVLFDNEIILERWHAPVFDELQTPVVIAGGRREYLDNQRGVTEHVMFAADETGFATKDDDVGIEIGSPGARLDF